MTITLEAETSTLEWVPAEADVVVGTGTAGGAWTAKIVDRYGVELVALPQVNLGKISRRLNQEAVTGFTLPRKLVDAYDAIDLLEAQLQVYRGESLRFFGSVQTEPGTATDKGEVPFGAAGPWSEFRYRLMGGWSPWSRNYLQNYRFDEGLARWIPTGTVSADTGTFETGSQSALMEGSTSSIAQSFLVDIALKFQLVVTARVRVGASASAARGLEVAVPGVQGGDGFRAAPITAATPKGTWTTLTTVLNVEGRVGARSATVSVFGADGDDVNVDRIEATIYPITALSESQPSDDPATEDMGVVIAQLIQSTNTGLNVGVDSPETGVAVAYTPDEWIDKSADEIMRIFTGREEGIEFVEVWTPTSRTIRARLELGVDWVPEDLTLSCPGNLTRLERSRNATDAVTEVTMIGDGGYRGVARDETAFGGLLRQKVMRAPSGVPIGDLEGRARKELKASVEAVTAIKATMTMADFVASGLDIGDRVVTLADADALQEDSVCRVVAIEEDPVKDLAELLLNPVPAVGS